MFVAGWGLEGQAAGSGVSATAGGDSFVDRLGNARPEIEAQGASSRASETYYAVGIAFGSEHDGRPPKFAHECAGGKTATPGWLLSSNPTLIGPAP